LLLFFNHYPTGDFINRLTVYCGSPNLIHFNMLNVIYNKAVKFNVEARHGKEISSFKVDIPLCVLTTAI
jgi:hypothetical protein